MQRAGCVHISVTDVNPHLTVAAQPHDCVDDVWVAGHTNLEHGRIIITVMFANIKVRQMSYGCRWIVRSIIGQTHNFFCIMNTRCLIHMK